VRDKELERLAQQAEKDSKGKFSRRLRGCDDFRYDEVQGKYWDTTTGTLLEAKSVDGAIPKTDWPTTTNKKGETIPVRPSIAINDIMTGLTVEGSTWWPGEPMFLENLVVNIRGAMKKKGAVTYNTYVPPDIKKPKKIKRPDPWIDHVKKLFPDKVEHEHFFDIAAHMIQKPYEKVNHGVVIAGAQGIGKDTMLHPLRHGVGQWNAAEIGPDSIGREPNGWMQSVLLVINEVRPHDEDHKASNFYNQLKELLASPPEMLAMRLLYANIIYVRNLCHVFLTTNDPLTMYIPREDRRLFVMTSPLPDPKINKVFKKKYFEHLWRYLLADGTQNVVWWLKKRSISHFNSADSPAVTRGKTAIIESANHIRRTLIDDLFDFYSEHEFGGKKPDIFFGKDLADFLKIAPFFDDKAACAKLLNAKNLHFKLNDLGYDMIQNPGAAQWKNGNFRSRAAFVAKEIPREKQLKLVAKELQKRPLVFNTEF